MIAGRLCGLLVIVVFKRGDPLHGDPLRGDPLHGAPLRGDPLRGDPLHGDPLHGAPLRGGRAGMVQHNFKLVRRQIAKWRINYVMIWEEYGIVNIIPRYT